jgi:hypothetical protein
MRQTYENGTTGIGNGRPREPTSLVDSAKGTLRGGGISQDQKARISRGLRDVFLDSGDMDMGPKEHEERSGKLTQYLTTTISILEDVGKLDRGLATQAVELLSTIVPTIHYPHLELLDTALVAVNANRSDREALAKLFNDIKKIKESGNEQTLIDIGKRLALEIAAKGDGLSTEIRT